MATIYVHPTALFKPSALMRLELQTGSTAVKSPKSNAVMLIKGRQPARYLPTKNML